MLPDGRLLLGFQGYSDTPGDPHLAAVAFSRDRGDTWSERVQRPGIGYSASWDGGGSWYYQGMLYRSPGPYQGWATACGYPSVVRLPDGELLCVFHTDFVDDDCEIRAVRLREVI